MTAYVRDGKRLFWGREVITIKDGARYEVIFSARDIRRERTGIHARVDIQVNAVTLAYSTFNIERDEDRVRLANSAFTQYSRNGLADDYKKDFIKKDLDLFCDGLWEEHVSELMPEMMGGTLTPSRPTFLLEPYIIEGGGTILFAPPGRGKSWSALVMAVAIDAGITTSLWTVKQTPVLFVNLERSAPSLRDRLGAVNAALGLPRERPLGTINARGRSLTDVYEACERWVTEHAVGCVILDSLSRAGVGDMNENLVGNRTMDLLNALVPTWFAPAHPPRKDPSHVFGSQMFDAAADVIVQVLSEQGETGPLGIGLQVTKVNDFRVPPMQLLAYEFDDYGLTSIRRARPGEFPEVEAGRKGNTIREMKEFILDQDGAIASGHEVAEALGKSRSLVSRLLRDRTEDFVFLRKQGRLSLYGVAGKESR